MKPLYTPGTERACTAEGCGKPFIGGGWGEYCPPCRRARSAAAIRRRTWTPEMDEKLRQLWGKGKKSDLLKIGGLRGLCARFGWTTGSRDSVKNRAAELGLPAFARPKAMRPWTAEEIAILEEHATEQTTRWIARKLRRSVRAVAIKLHRLGLSGRISAAAADGYTIEDLAPCLGENPRAVTRWIALGYFGQIRYRYGGAKPSHERDPRIITDLQVLEFVRQHPTVFQLARVDQDWFMGLVFSRTADKVKAA